MPWDFYAFEWPEAGEEAHHTAGQNAAVRCGLLSKTGISRLQNARYSAVYSHTDLTLYKHKSARIFTDYQLKQAKSA